MEVSEFIKGAGWALEIIKGFVDCCDAEGLTKHDHIEAMQAVIGELERCIEEKLKEK